MEMAITQEELIRRVAAVSTELRLDGSTIFPSVRLAQAILETGGQAPSWNNIFGIKVGTGELTPYWDGSYVNRTTREVISGEVIENMPVQWRAYDSIEDCVRDHELFLQKARYAPVRNASGPQEQCMALYTTGYATDAPASVDGDPSYGEKLWSVIQSRGLLRYDAEADATAKELQERLSRLEAGTSGLSARADVLEESSVTDGVPEWAREAMEDAVAKGLVDTPSGGSYDFYRILTVLYRSGLLGAQSGAVGGVQNSGAADSPTASTSAVPSGDPAERLAQLEARTAELLGRTGTLEEGSSLPEVPEWAKAAVDRAVADGLIDTPEGGSYDFYRVLVVLARKGLL
jgi:hypothetical protein